MGLCPHGDDDCIQEVARVEEEDGDGGWVALWRPSRTPPRRGRLFQSAEWGGALEAAGGANKPSDKTHRESKSERGAASPVLPGEGQPG